MNTTEIKNLIVAFGFTPENADEKVFIQKYSQHNNYQLAVDFQNKKIRFPNPITVHDETTSHFSQPENFVVLECIHRLLQKGYEPRHLELERKWTLGRSAKGGKADVTVFDREGKALIVIEC